MKKYKCDLCRMKRPAGILHVVKLNSQTHVLVCNWCTSSILRTLADEDMLPPKGIETAFSDTFINEERVIARIGAKHMADIKRWSEVNE